MKELVKEIGKKATLKGWVKKSRRLGDLIFIDLRNLHGIIQIVFDAKNKFYQTAQTLRNEDVIIIEGKIVKRSNVNKKLDTGTIEIIASNLEIVSKAKQTPLIIDDVTDALEAIRMEYRYLDLRRPINQKHLLFRSKLNKIIRDFFTLKDFIEIDTPIITRSTIGGANELKVLSSNHQGKEYSLVQSPQIYKQLLMYSGFEKYYQIAKCFRDEDSRSDRQLEFTQLDLELSFTTQTQIQALIEELMQSLFKQLLNVTLPSKFEVLTYEQAMNKYGSDKPDLRIKEKIIDLTSLLKTSSINLISNLIKKGNVAKGIVFVDQISTSQIKKQEAIIKSEGGNGLAWVRVEHGKIVAGSLLNQISPKELAKLIETIKKNTFTLFVLVGEEKSTLEILGRFRVRIATKIANFDPNKFLFVWVTSWPLFELTADNKIEAMHNPFTGSTDPKFESALKGDITKLTKHEILSFKAQGYDLVLNGSEIGGGAIRINDPIIQTQVFRILGYKDSEIEEHFGWFLRAQEFGTPQHGGIALGIDRILSLMLKTESIRDVIAFPKSTRGTDEMSKAPTKILKS